MKRLFAYAWLILLGIIILPQSEITGCIETCSETQWGYGYHEFNRYSVSETNKTKEGVAYDPSGLPISPELIDRLTNEVQSCLTAAFPNGSLPPDVVSSSQCAQNRFQLPIQKQNFAVKIANDSVLSCDGTEELLPNPVMSGPTGCVAKGEVPNASCPCRWRAGIQCPNVIIVTPSFFLYKDALTRFITTCRNPWIDSRLAQCASPSTTPLSDGSDPNNGLK